MTRAPRPAAVIVAAVALALGVSATAQSVVALNAVIGPSGTDAANVAGAGNAVNFVWFASNGGATTLTASGSAGSSAFDFNSGFSDQIDRASGANPNAGSAHVFADRKYDSASTGPLILDLNHDGNFSEGALPGFGMHSDGFVTFDLAVIRAAHALASDTPFTLTGLAGMANAPLTYGTSGAIIADSQQLAVFDWGVGHAFDSYSLSIGGNVRYLTFIGLSGQDQSTHYAHVGYANVELTVVPEPGSAALLALGGMALAWWRRRGGNAR